jgi:hypothetical protein
MKTFFAVIVIGIMPLFLFSQSSTTDLTISPDSVFFIPGNPGLATVYVHIFLDPSLISSVQDHSKFGFPVFPNPAMNRITIDLPVEEPDQLLEVVDALGKVIMTRTLTVRKTQLDISSLPGGVYFVRLSGGKSLQVGKFLKQ